jgi:hypothetical protein
LLNLTLGRPGGNSEGLSAHQTITVSAEQPDGVLDLGEIVLQTMVFPAKADGAN